MDLDEAQSVEDEDAKDLARQINGIFMKTSSKTGENKRIISRNSQKNFRVLQRFKRRKS